MKLHVKTAAFVIILCCATSIASAGSPPLLQASSTGQEDGTGKKKQNGWLQFLSLLTNAGNGAIVGQWQGGKTVRNSIGGGYFNLDFAFQFYPNGEYSESIYDGGQQIMTAHGTYQIRPGRRSDDPSVTDLLTLAPDTCTFTSEDYANEIRIADLPNREVTEEFVGFSKLAPGGQMTLSNTVTGRMSGSWGLKRVH